jgi:hypothetical protein
MQEQLLTTPTLCPGWKFVPRCVTSTCPGNASCPFDIFVPRYLGREPFLFLVEPPCFLVALQDRRQCGTKVSVLGLTAGPKMLFALVCVVTAANCCYSSKLQDN